MQAGVSIVKVLNDVTQLNQLTPGKQCYTVILELFITVLDTLEQETHTRAKIQSPVDEVPTQSVCG